MSAFTENLIFRLGGLSSTAASLLIALHWPIADYAFHVKFHLDGSAYLALYALSILAGILSVGAGLLFQIHPRPWTYGVILGAAGISMISWLVWTLFQFGPYIRELVSHALGHG